MRLLVSVLLTGVVVVLLGCGFGSASKPQGRVSGTVTLEGKLLPSGVVILENADRGISASAEIREGGFEFRDPIEAGEFLVVIKPPPPPAPHEMTAENSVSVSPIPARYHTGKSSGLTTNVQPGRNVFEFTLSK